MASGATDVNDADAYRCATNFYLSPDMKDSDYGINKSQHGKKRYDTMMEALKAADFRVTATEAAALLKAVAQPATGQPTSHTQWSSLYDLSSRSLKLWLLGDFDGQPLEISAR